MEIYGLEISQDQIEEVETLLRRHNPFVLGGIKTEDQYSISGYLQNRLTSKYRVHVLLDRNLVTRIVDLANGKVISSTAQDYELYRIAAACMAFFIVGDVWVEPSMALYEYAAHQGHQSAVNDFSLFRVADNLGAQVYADFVSRMSYSIPIEHIKYVESKKKLESQQLSETNFLKELTRWKLNYPFIVKIVCLARKNDNRVNAIIEFFEWMKNEAFFNAAATTFAIILLGYSPKASVIKRIHTGDRNELLRNIRNSTWDVCYISQWGKYVRDGKKMEPEQLWMFASCDKACRAMASAIFDEYDYPASDKLRGLIENNWNKESANSIIKVYEKIIESASILSENRKKKIDEKFKNIDDLIVDVEKELMELL